MPFDLSCGSDVATFVLYDPGAVLHLINAKSVDASTSQVEAEAAKGALIAYSYAGDGDMSFRIFVDEPVDPELERRADGKVEGILRVPTGRLIASGAEYLSRSGKSDVSADDFHPERGTEHVIPSGNYAVLAFDVEWGEEAEEAGENAAKGASPTGVAVEKVLGPFTGLLVFGSILGFGITGCSVVFGDTTLRGIWEVIKNYGLWYAGVWAAVIALWRLTPVRNVLDARAEEHGKYPGAVVHLRRLTEETEDIAGRKGCAFGIGFK